MNPLNKIIHKIISNRVLLHALYWLGVFALYCLFGLGHGQPVFVSFFLYLTVFPVQILASYVFIYWQIPKLFQKQYLRFFVLLIGLSFPFYWLVHINYDLGIGRYLISWHKPHSLWVIFSELEFYLRYTVDVYLVVFVTATIKFIKDHLEARQEMENLKAEMMRVEYNILQSKLRPDFVLRSLALIKSQSLVRPSLASGTISHLSIALDDILYQSQKEVRDLAVETERLNSYVQLFAGSSKNISAVTFDSQLDDSNWPIKTLVLNKLLSSVLEQIEKSEEELALNIVVIRKNERCITQATLTPFPKFELSFDAARDFLDIVYKDRYQILEIDEGESKDIQFIIEL